MTPRVAASPAAEPIFDFRVDDSAQPGDVVGALAALLIDLAQRRRRERADQGGNAKVADQQQGPDE